MNAANLLLLKVINDQKKNFHFSIETPNHKPDPLTQKLLFLFVLERIKFKVFVKILFCPW